jgi:integrase
VAVGKITKESVDEVSTPAKGQREYLWDETVKGFGLMVTDKGARSYILQYRIGGRGSSTRRVTIGKHGSPWTPANARKRALELLEQVRRKVDPFDAGRAAETAARAEKDAEKKRAVVLQRLAFDKMAGDYIDKGTFVDGRRIGSWETYQRIIERDLKPKFGTTPLPDITSDDITEMLQEIGERGASAERRAHVVLSNIYQYAAKAEKRHFNLKSSPMLDVPSPESSGKRDNHLRDDELRLVWKGAGGLGWPWCEIVRQLALTGQRLREVAHIPEAELNLSERAWIIAGDRTKNGDTHLVPISDSALTIWEGAPRIKNDAGLLFPSSAGTPLSAMSKMKAKLDGIILALMKEEAADAGADPDVVKVRPWRIHDLRRTASVGMQRRGVPREVIDEVLNHRTGGRTGITGVYQVYRFAAEKAEALAKWDALLSSIVNQATDSNVISMTERRA